MICSHFPIINNSLHDLSYPVKDAHSLVSISFPVTKTGAAMRGTHSSGRSRRASGERFRAEPLIVMIRGPLAHGKGLLLRNHVSSL
jgi:hypothetical protein